MFGRKRYAESDFADPFGFICSVVRAFMPVRTAVRNVSAYVRGYRTHLTKSRLSSDVVRERLRIFRREIDDELLLCKNERVQIVLSAALDALKPYL
jgi:hypothetical protein